MSEPIKKVIQGMGGGPAHIRMIYDAIERRAAMTPEDIAEAEELDRKQRARSQQESQRAQNRLIAGLEGVMSTRSFEGLRIDDPTQAEAVTIAKRFVTQFPQGVGFCLWGSPGRGKSGIMQAVANAILDSPRLCRVLYVPCLEISEYLKRIDLGLASQDAKLVIFDDIEKGLDRPGARYRSEGDTAIKSVINRADRTRALVICCTSNHPPEWFSANYGPSFASRLCGLMDWHHIAGTADLRKDRSYQKG